MRHPDIRDLAPGIIAAISPVLDSAKDTEVLATFMRRTGCPDWTAQLIEWLGAQWRQGVTEKDAAADIVAPFKSALALHKLWVLQGRPIRLPLSPE